MSFEIIELLSEINAQGTTILVVTHEHDLVRHFNKRVIEIEKGRVISDTKHNAEDLYAVTTALETEMPDIDEIVESVVSGDTAEFEPIKEAAAEDTQELPKEGN